MIVIHIGDLYLADREWLAAHHCLSVETIRKLLVVNRIDAFTGRALYDIEAADRVLRGRSGRTSGRR